MLNPLLLWLLPAALLPVVLHLLARRRPQPVDFPTVRFLMETRVEHRARQRLTEWLLLLLRVLVLAAIIVAVSRPLSSALGLGGVGGQGGLASIAGISAITGGQRDVVIILDASASMADATQRAELNWSLDQTLSNASEPAAEASPESNPGESPWAQAVAAAERVVLGLGTGDHLTLIHAGQAATAAYRGYVRDPQRVIDTLTELRPERRPARLAAAFDVVAANPPVGVRSVYLISGGSATAWAGLDEHASLAALDRSTGIAVMPVDTATRRSALGLQLAWPDDIPATVSVPRQLRLTVTNPEPDAATQVLRVQLGGRLVDQRNITVGGLSQRTFTVAITPLASDLASLPAQHDGTLTGVAWLGTQPPEQSVAAWFYLRPQTPPRVLMVSQQLESQDISDPALYVWAALRAAFAGDSRDTPAGDRAAGAAVQRQSVFTLQPQHLAAADCVVLVDAAWPAGLADELRAHVETGGGLVVLPGAAMDEQALDNILPGVTERIWSLGRGDAEDPSTFGRLEVLRPDHAVMRIFDAVEDEPLASVQVYEHRAVRRPASAGHPLSRWTPLVRVAGGGDVIALATLGNGRVVFSGLSGGPGGGSGGGSAGGGAGGSDLPLKPSFVPLLSRLCHWASAGRGSRTSPSVAVGDPIVLSLALTDAGDETIEQVQAVLPDGQRVKAPVQRVLDQAVARFGPTTQVGRHTLTMRQKSSESDQTLTREFHIAVNPAGTAGVQEVLSPAQQLAVINSARNDAADARLIDPKAVELAAVGQSTELWRLLIVLMLGFMVAEVLLSTARAGRGGKSSGASDDEESGGGGKGKTGPKRDSEGSGDRRAA